LLAVEKTCPSMTSQVDLFIIQEIGLLSECLNDPADEFEELTRPSGAFFSTLQVVYILWIQRQQHRFYAACFYNNRVFATIDSYVLKGLGLTGKLLRVLLDAASPGSERESWKRGCIPFPLGG
jgi:hypothetical protein